MSYLETRFIVVTCLHYMPLIYHYLQCLAKLRWVLHSILLKSQTSTHLNGIDQITVENSNEVEGKRIHGLHFIKAGQHFNIIICRNII